MLVLSRKKGESVVVNGNITIVVVDVRGDKARIGIEAPADVAVYRSEILSKNASANESDAEAETKSRPMKKDAETSERAKRKNVRGARKETGVLLNADADVENAVETLYLSSEGEAYRRADAIDADCETNETDEAKETINDVK
ncbi:MAG: carbon storage regulator [Thermoguttaceae bacterium]|nr:carbon storage regulator [Thermoguttaceae bacterium]